MRAIHLLAAFGCLLVQLSEPSTVPTLLTVPQRQSQRQRAAAVASLSTDGRHIAFTSSVRLAPADDDDRVDVYVLDRTSGDVTLESLSADGLPLDGECGWPGLSGDGRYLVFETTTDALDPGSSIVLRDRAADVSRRISRNRVGLVAAAGSIQPHISEDGRFVVFASNATGLTNDPPATLREVYRYSVADGQIERVSIGTGVLPGGQSVQPRISGDGRIVAFASSADLVPLRTPQPVRDRSTPAAAAEQYQVFARDMESGVTTQASVAMRGRPPDGPSLEPSISRDGRYVAFSSRASNLVSGDRNNSSDVFVFDRATGAVTLVSRSAAGGSANGHSAAPVLSADGRYVAFQSGASDLLCARQCRGDQEDIDLVDDVFLHDRVTGEMTLVSSGSAPWMEESASPALDGRGTVVAFASRHPIDGRDLAHDFDLFVSLAPHGTGRVARRLP